jgi:signal transduction histidine kinase
MQVDSDGEVLRLREGLRDLVALSAMPAVWIGTEPPAVAAGLADALVGLLGLDFAFVRLSDPPGAAAVEVTRGSAWTSFRDWLDSRLATGAPLARKEVVPDTDDTSSRRCGLVVPVGIDGDGGLIAAASERSDFPTPMDELLLTLAANHAAVAFQSASLIHERTAELSAANDELSALRRIATLVARAVEPDEIFSAVSDEVGRLFGSDLAAVTRFEHDPPANVVVGVAPGIEGVTIGSRWETDDAQATARVYRTGRSARVDAVDWSAVSAPVAAAGRSLGMVSTVSSPIFVEDRLWGAVSVWANEPLPLGTEQRQEKFAELLATALANAEGKSELTASRRRIVAAADEARRRIERDLHDGTQQRLVSLGLAMRAAEADVPPDKRNLRAELSRIATGLADAVTDLQEISRGIHPAILSKGGLGPALRTLARRSTIPVDLDVTGDVRLPEPIEVAAYYVASEALANAIKHAQASRIEASLATRNGRLLLSIRDDGVGGADLARGSGLVGLSDRVQALGGSIRVSSPPGEGTCITAELPLDQVPS